MITINLNLSQIPKETIFDGKLGKYINLVVEERREPDRFGNTHTVYISQSKEEREAKKDKVYIGSGKEYKFENKPKEEPKPEPKTPFTDQVNNDSENKSDDLPF